MLKARDSSFDSVVPWLTEARRLSAEGPGAPPGGEYPTPDRRMIRWIYSLNRLTPVRLPWCGLFVAHCLRQYQPEIELPAGHPRARPWLDWGTDCAPQLGALMIFWHYAPQLPFGHVAFYIAEDDTTFHVLGGNQLNRVCVMRYPKTRLLGCRWPEGARQTGYRQTAPKEHARPFG